MADLQAAKQTLDAYASAVGAIVEAVSPAVVRVKAARSRSSGKWKHGRARTNYGSGVIVDAEAGYIVTNFHVLHGASEAYIKLHDGSEVTGRVLGADADVDLAVLQVEAENLTALTWGDAAALHMGSPVFAFGNPDGDQVVVTSGIVSNIGRALRGPSGRLMEDLIQTDAIFNPGMSGGPLVNSGGEVVGINTASIVEAQGINLAISSTLAAKLAKDLVHYGEVKRPRLGIAGERQRIYAGLVKHHNLAQSHGVFIHDVQDSSPAANAGIQSGDILTGADDQVLEGLDDLHRVLVSKSMGDSMTIRLLRDLELLEVSVTLSTPDADSA